MRRSLDELLQAASMPSGRSEAHKAAMSVFKEAPARPATLLDRTTAAAKLVIEEELSARSDKTARLREAREARAREQAK